MTQALQRNLIATMATNAKGEPATPLHLRYELKITDYKNKPHTGTYETWIGKDGVRTAIHTDAYDESDLTKGDSVWAIEKGLRPLRIMEFAEVHWMYRGVLVTAMRGDQKMKARTVDGVSLTCGGQDAQRRCLLRPGDRVRRAGNQGRREGGVRGLEAGWPTASGWHCSQELWET